jgi:nucleotide-binding universal stress UspA family protein
MDIKDILLFLEAGQPAEACVQIAARVAREYGAQVSGVCLYREPQPTMADGYAIGPDAVGDVLERQRQSVVKLTAPAQRAFDKAITAHALSSGWWLAEPDEAPQVSVLRARFADLSIVPGSARRLAECLAVDSGAPCLMAPADWSRKHGFRRVVLAWNGKREAKRAMDDALPILWRADAVNIVIVEEKETRDRMGELRPALLRHLAHHGIQAEIESAPPAAGAGEVLLERCRAFDADLLVMGAYSHSRAAELILGGATRTVIDRAALPVLLSH